MRTKFAILLAIAAVCVTTAWAGWTSDSLVTGSPDVWRTLQTRGRNVVFGTDGVGHLVWGGGPLSIGLSGVWYNRYNPGSGSRPGYWGPDFGVAPYSTKKKVMGCVPCVALDGDGRTIHVVWYARPPVPSWPDNKPDTVCYQRCTQDRRGNDKWDAPVPLYAANYPGGPVVTCAPNEPNHVFVCWRNLVPIAAGGYSMVIRFREYVNGAWTGVVRLDSSYMAPQDGTSIAAAPNGDVFVAYAGYGEGTTGTQIFVKTRHNGVWGEPANVTKSFSSIYLAHYTIEVNPTTGNPHVVFTGRTAVPNGEGLDTIQAVYHTFRNSSGDWLTPPEAISEPRYWRLAGGDPRTAFGSDGAAHVIWHDTVPPASVGIMYSSCLSEGGTWSTPEWLTTYRTSGRSITVGEPAHTIRVVWNRITPGNLDPTEIWWKSNYLGGGGSQAAPMALSQSSIELYPNPAKAGLVTVHYALPHAGPMTVTLLDVSGRAVKTQEVAATNRSGSFSIDAKGLKAGVYVMKLESGTTSLTRKFVIH